MELPSRKKYDICIESRKKCHAPRPLTLSTYKYEVKTIKLVLIVLLFIALFWDVGLLGFSFTRNDKRGVAYFALLAGSLFLYTLGYLLEMISVTPGEVMLALRVENLGIPLVAPVFLLTTLGFYQPKSLRKWMLPAALTYSTIMSLIVFTNDYHHIYYASVSLVQRGEFLTAVMERGPMYYVVQVSTFIYMGTAYAILAVRFIRGSAKLRRQMLLFIIGSFFGFATNIANILKVAPLNLDFMPIALTLGLIFFAITLQRHKLLDIVSVAFDMAVETMNDALVVLDNEWCFIYCNQKARELFPVLATYAGTESIEDTPGWPVALHPQAEQQVTLTLEDPTTARPTFHRASIDAIRSKLGKDIGVFLLIRDITEITGVLNNLEAQAITDPLTGVFNRRHFATLVDRQMSMARRHDMPISLLLFDIDHFKSVNDTYSHLAGDHVLCRVVEVVTRQMRTYDVMARYGGEEFVVLSTESDEDALIAFANRLRKAIEQETIAFEHHAIRITASFGVVVLLPGQSYEAGMDAADRALYAAKHGGRNCVVLGKTNP